MPPGTALLSVHGPVGSDPAWTHSLHADANTPELSPLCTFLLDPQPAWFNNSAPLNVRFPLAWQDASSNKSDTTLFLVPLDPEINYKITVLSRNNASVCVVSGIRTYPFKL